MEHVLEVRIAHADLVHVLEGVANVIHARPALANPLRHQARAPVQVELAHVRGVSRIGDKSERLYPAAAAQPHRHEARLIDAPWHLAMP